MEDAHRKQIDQNYDFLQRNLSRYLPKREGQYALLRNGEVIEFYEKVGDAYRDALQRFADEEFSIQLVTREPVELGNWSVALA